MADVFISYKAERRRAARHLSKVLAAHGFSVWYDYGLLPGEDFEQRLLAELNAAKTVVVLWCGLSVKSEWVNREARIARAERKFLPCWLESAQLPDEFSGADTINLSAWDASPRSHMLDRLIDDIARRVGHEPAVNYRELRDLEDDWRGFGAPSLAQFALTDPPRPLEERSVRAQPAPKKPSVTLRTPPTGVTANLAETWKRAQAGDIAAITNIASAYTLGTGGVAKDESEALRLYKFASDQGNPVGQTGLGFMYEKGLGGVAKDDVEAVRLYRLAADQGDVTGQANLGYMYAKGLGGLIKDEREAVRLYRLAAEQGDARAQAKLGYMYANGLGGLKEDQREAVRLYKLAAQQDDDWAIETLKRRGETP